jgi:hypothetical protein
VYRNGIDIGRADLTIENPEQPLGTHVFMAIDTGGQDIGWKSVGIPSDGAPAPDPAEVERLQTSNEFSSVVGAILTPGVTLIPSFPVI